MFLAVVALLASGVAGFVQSARFADIAKSFLDRNIPADWGIGGDFEEVQLGVFPPTVRIVKPRVTLGKRNILNLPEGAQVAAAAIELRFYPFQILAGNFRVHEAVIIDGNVDLTIDPRLLKPAKKTKEPAAPLSWKEIVEIRADSLLFENTRVQVKWTQPKVTAGFLAQKLRITQAFAKGVWGVQLVFVLSDIVGEYPKHWPVPRRIDQLSAFAQVSTEGASLQKAKLEADGLHMGGAVKLYGDVFEADSLQVSGDLGVRADLAKVLQLIGLGPKATGQMEFAGKIQGDLARLKETVEVSGKVSGTDVAFQGWHADRLELLGNWTPKEQRIISIEKGEIEEAVLAREGGKRARGGKIKIGAFEIPLVSAKAIQIPLEVENAHLHWFLGPGLEDVFGLEFRTTGKIEVGLTPGDAKVPWGVRAQLDLKMPWLELNNQRLGKTRPLSRVVRSKSLHLVGGVDVDAKGLRPRDLKLRAGGRSDFEIGGEVNFKTGYGLKVRSEIDLEDIELIAENPIRGQGSLGLSIHGPSSDAYLDFDLDIRNAVYLSLNLGHLKGRLTWADDAADLLFKKIEMALPQSRLIADGKIATPTDKVDLTFQIRRGDVSDLIWLFDALVKDVSWFPSSLTGATEGVFLVNGGLDMAKLNVEARLMGEDWSYMGERFDQVNLHGGYSEGHYNIRQLSGRKYGASFLGRYLIEKSGPSWFLETKNLNLKDFDLVGQLDVPVRGQMTLRSEGRTQGGTVLSDTSLSLTGVSVRGDPYPASFLRAHSEKGILTVEGSANGGEAELDWVMGFQPDSPNSLRIRVQRYDCSPALMILNPRLVKDRKLSGRISGALEATFKGQRLDTATGSVSLDELQLQKSDIDLALVRPVTAALQNGDLSLRNIQFSAADQALIGTLDLKKGKLGGILRGRLDLGVGTFLTSVLQEAKGFADLDLRLEGEPLSPELGGKVLIQGQSLGLSFLEGPVTDLKGSVQVKKNVFQFQDLEGRFAGGRLQIGGTTDVTPGRFPRLDMRVTLADNRVAVYPFSYAQTRGIVTLKGDRIPYHIGGRVQVTQALSREKILDRKGGASRRVTKFSPDSSGSAARDRSLFSLGIQVEAPSGILVRNDLFDAELKAKVDLVNTVDAPRILGKAETLRGRLFFKNHAFQLDNGEIEFDSPTVLNPKFDLNAKAEVKNTRITLAVSGELDKMKIALSSDPPLPENEILSLLAIGLTQDELRRLKTADQSAIQQSEAASLVLHTLDFNRDIKDRTGLEISVDESVNHSEGTSIFRPQTGLESSAAPKIVIKRNIEERVDLSVGTTVGVGTTSEREVSAEVHVAPGLSVIGIWNSTEGTTTQGQTTSYGVDLKFQKRFR